MKKRLAAYATGACLLAGAQVAATATAKVAIGQTLWAGLRLVF